MADLCTSENPLATRQSALYMTRRSKSDANVVAHRPGVAGRQVAEIYFFFGQFCRTVIEFSNDLAKKYETNVYGIYQHY